MAFLTTDNIRLAGLAACVPSNKENNMAYDHISETERKLLIKTTGIEERRVAKPGLATSDLCYHAAIKLIDDLKWNKEEIELLIFVSQSRDYFLPATGIILQDRLGLPTSCVALDIGLGCSGYIYGLSVISAMMSSGKWKKGLLLVGDISTNSIAYSDKSTYPLFGDAGTATALEYSNGKKMYFNLQSDGKGYEAIIIPHGGLRHTQTAESTIRREIEPGIIRSDRDLALNGLEVFNFSLREVAPNIKGLLTYAEKKLEDLDYAVFHQANLLMNETIRKKLGLPAEKVPYTLKDFGNTSSASIPLTMVARLKNELQKSKKNILLSGFGVGLSWGSAWIETENLVISDLIEV
ncbi:MAG: ketoacyl-ACP synthase III [Flavobacteriales bacterium]